MKSVLILVALMISAVSSVTFAGQCGNTYCQAGFNCIQSRCLPGDPCYFEPYCKYAGPSQPAVDTSICARTSNGYGYAVSTAVGDYDICSRLGYYGQNYYGGHYTGSPNYICCYDPYAR